MKFVTCSLLLIFSGAVTAQQGTQSENLFIITTDGFRWQEVFNGADPELISNPKFVQDTALLKQLYWDSTAELRRQKLMPFFWNTIACQGQLHGNRTYQNNIDVTNIFKISYPGYNEMLTGYADPFFIPNIPIRNRNINFLEYLDAKEEFCGRVAAFSSWNLFTAILNKKRNHLPGNCGYENLVNDSTVNAEMINEAQDNRVEKKHTRYDLLTYLSAREYIDQKHPRVVLISFGETDEFAHQGRYDMYLHQAANVDKMISELWYFVQTNSFYKNKTTFIITTDHGRGKKPTAWFKHGIFTSGSGEIWLAAIGAGIRQEGEVKTIEQNYQKQIASTFTQLLGESFNTKRNHADPLLIPMEVNFNYAKKD